MTTGIGFRVSPNEIFFTVVESTDPQDTGDYHEPQILVVPDALEGPDLLRFMRTNLLDVLELYDADRAAVKTADHYRKRSSNTTRVHLEGVIQEAVANSRVKRYVSGATPKLAPLQNMSSDEFKDYKDGTRQFADLPDWNRLSNAERESILAAATSLTIA
jgi:hypothetical protein